MINFYLFQKEKYILISDYPLSTIRRRHGYSFEILTNVKDKNSLDTIKERIARQYPKLEIKYRIRTPVNFTPEIRNKIRLKKLGKKRCDVFKNKLRVLYRGRSIFQGQKHTLDYKKFMSNIMKGNSHNKGTFWVYNPYTDEEKKVRDRNKIPEGFRLGRNPYSVDNLSQPKNSGSTSSPKEKLPKRDL